MAESVLRIILEYQKQAAQEAARNFHQGERQRIAETSGAQTKADKTAEKTAKEKAVTQTKATKDVADAARKAAEDQERYDRDYIRAVKLKVNAIAAFAKEIEARERERLTTKKALDREAEQSFAQYTRKSKADAQSLAASLKQIEAQSAADAKNTAKLREEDAKTAFRQRADYHQQVMADAATQDRLTKARRSAGRQLFQEEERYHASGRTALLEEAAAWERTSGRIDDANVKLTKTQQRTLDIVPAAKKTESSIMGVARAYTIMRGAALLNEMFMTAWQAIAKSAEDARTYIDTIATKMEGIRETVREIAALEGKQPTAMYSAEQARQAGAAGSNTADYVEGKRQYYAFSAQYIGPENATPEQEAANQKLGVTPRAEAEAIHKNVAAMAGALGVKQADIMPLVGTMMGRRAPGETVAQTTTKIRRLLETAKQAKGLTGPFLEQLNQTVSELAGPGKMFKTEEEAAIFQRAVAEGRPAEAATYTSALARELQERLTEPDEAEEKLGIKFGMSMEQMITAIHEKAGAAVAAGEAPSEAIWLESKKGGNLRERRAYRAIQATLGHPEVFARAKKELEPINEQFSPAENKKFLGGDVAQRNLAATSKDSGQIEAATRSQGHRNRQDQASRALAAARTLEERESIFTESWGEFGAALQTAKGAALGYGDREHQIKRELEARALDQQLQGFEEGREFSKAHMSAFGAPLGGRYADEDVLMDADNMIKRHEAAHAQDRGGPANEVPVTAEQAAQFSGGKDVETSAEQLTRERKEANERRGNRPTVTSQQIKDAAQRAAFADMKRRHLIGGTFEEWKKRGGGQEPGAIGEMFHEGNDPVAQRASQILSGIGTEAGVQLPKRRGRQRAFGVPYREEESAEGYSRRQARSIVQDQDVAGKLQKVLEAIEQNTRGGGGAKVPPAIPATPPTQRR